jgi:sirohydrochlorin cobaltochelatase
MNQAAQHDKSNAPQAVHGLILFAHGSRDATWAQPFEAMLGKIAAAAPQRPCVLAYLELMQPNFASACAQLVALGVTHIRVLPAFLAVGKHLRVDLPEFVAQAQRLHSGLHIEVLPAAGLTQSLQDAMVALALQPSLP